MLVNIAFSSWLGSGFRYCMNTHAEFRIKNPFLRIRLLKTPESGFPIGCLSVLKVMFVNTDRFLFLTRLDPD